MAAGKLWHIRELIIRRIMNTDKYIYDENNGLWYESQGDYYIPCLMIPEEDQQPIGVWEIPPLSFDLALTKSKYQHIIKHTLN